LLAIACSLSLTAIALTPVHGHASQQHCDVCVSAHLAGHQAVHGFALIAPIGSVWETAPERIVRIAESYSGFADGRAPPSAS